MKTEPTNRPPDNDEQDIYAATTDMCMIFGGATAGLLLWLMAWCMGRRDTDLLSLLTGGAILGLPAAWLTARSVRKRNLRRDWRGCLKTAAFGAWWSTVTVGGVLSLFVLMVFVAQGRVVLSELLLCFGVPAAIGAVSALLLSVFLPKPET